MCVEKTTSDMGIESLVTYIQVENTRKLFVEANAVDGHLNLVKGYIQEAILCLDTNDTEKVREILVNIINLVEHK